MNSKPAPYRAALQWRWRLEKRTYHKTLKIPPVNDGEVIPVTQQAKIHARDHHVDLRFVKGTGKDGRISKADVLAYMSDRKPVVDVTETRYPKMREIFQEVCGAMMLVTQRLKGAVFLWMDVNIEGPEDDRHPVIIVEWGIKGGRAGLSRMKNRDNRFGMLAARKDNPWGKRWGNPA